MRLNKLTFFGQDGDADARIAQFDKWGVSSPSVILSDQKNIFSADIPVNKMLVFLQVQKGRESLINTEKISVYHSVFVLFFLFDS